MTKRETGLADLIRSALGVYRVSVKEPEACGRGEPAATTAATRFHLPTFAAVVESGRALPGDPEECEAVAEEPD